MKSCFKCGVEKPLAEFYKHQQMPDGHLNKCKECTKIDVKTNRDTKKDYYLEYDRNRPNKDERNLSHSERHKLKYHSDETFRKSVKQRKRGWVERNPLKRKAQCAAGNAVRDGKLERKTSCEHCDTTESKLQKHHWSYSEEHWLDVVWLCTKCHGKEHKRLNDLGRDPDKIN